MAKRPAPATRTSVRCAIYTRKSTEEGLEQEFNSLDAQREACEAYITSQRHEGWTLVRDAYDDGGFSGGNMERPGLKRLLADIEAGKVDVIVVYKVDRLTRSLADFAKIVDVLDAKGASFVSVTQSFNTTTSMGRLTLNVLLSFAQFEREVTGERIRDKIAASKKKGLWMGGPVPLGYDVEDRKLVVNEDEAELVRHIMQRYLALPSVKALAAELARDGHRTKVQIRKSGPHKGGCKFQRGTLYHLLSNRIYLGEIVHKGSYFPGEHPPIVPIDLWQEVQEKLAVRGPGPFWVAPERKSHLIGLLFDGDGQPMTPNHAKRGTKRYRYYVTREPADDQTNWRVGAHDIEQLVEGRIRQLLQDKNRIMRMAADSDPARAEAAAAKASKLADAKLPTQLEFIGRIDLKEERLDIQVNEGKLLQACGITVPNEHQGIITLTAPVERVRRGHELKLIIAGEEKSPAPFTNIDQKLVALISEAIEVRNAVIARPDTAFSAIATELGRCRKHMAKIMPISWLAPDIVEMIAKGEQPASLTVQQLMNVSLPVDWKRQRVIFGL